MLPKLTSLLATFWLLLANTLAAEVTVDQLRCEYRDNPLGIDVAAPRLSWMLVSTARGQRQTAYQVLAAGSAAKLAADQGDLWDSGKVASDQSTQVEYAGRKLASETPVWWKVRVWDAAGQPSPWSKPATWSMGLLEPSAWQGQWIGRDEAAGGGDTTLKQAQWIWFAEGKPAQSAPIGTRYFRRTVELPKDRGIARATCYITADNGFTLYVNGQKVGKGNDFHHVATLDVTKRLAPGTNVLAAAAENVGDAPNPAGLLAALKVEFAAGDPLVVLTDAAWRGAAEKSEKWTAAQFDDARWPAAVVLGRNGMSPWKEVSAADESRRLPARMLRREFALAKPVRRAMAYVCGLGYHELYVNGKKAGDAVLEPALSEYERRDYYLTYDVTDQLRAGRNCVGAMLGNGRYYAPRQNSPTFTRTFGYPKLLLQLNIEYADGSRQSVISDANWKLTTDGPISANNDYDGEVYDARRELPGWASPGFDDAAWSAAQVVAAPGGQLAAQMIPSMRVTATIEPVAITQPQPGVYVFDLGQNMVGWCRLTVQGPRGTVVSLRHAETLQPDGMLYVANLRGAKATDDYTLRGEGVEVYEPRFTYHGFRYVEVRGFPGAPTKAALQGRVVHTALRSAGSFECSNRLINRIYHNIFWGVRGNYLSIPTDCPQRDERQGWQGDRAAESRGESYLFETVPLYAKWMQDIEDSQKPDGNLSDVAPAYWPLYHPNVTWPSAYVIIPGTLYEQFGDRRVLSTHFATQMKWMDFLAQFLKNGIIDKDNYGDWCVPPESPRLIHSQDPARKTPKDLLATAYYENNLRLLARYATLLGKPTEAAALSARADVIAAAFQKKFFDSATHQYGNGSQTSQVLPLSFGLVPADQRRAVFAGLVQDIEQKTHGHIGTGLIGGQWLLRTLSDNGRPDLAYRLLANTDYPSWGYMVEHGATTVWELWNGNTADPAMNSGNHVMLVGDLTIWLFEYLAGIQTDPARPGFQHLNMRPLPVGDLRFVGATHESPYGTIRSAWKIADGRFRWEIALPPNSSATVYVPSADPAGVRELGAGDAGVKRLRDEARAAAFEIGSGSYVFESKWPPK